MSERPDVVRVQVETVTPQQRTIFLVLLGIGLVITGMVAARYNWLETVVSVITIAAFHLAMNWRDPSSSAVMRPSRMAGTLAQVQTDAPFMTFLISRQSRVFELAKGVGKGILFALAHWALLHGYTLLLTPINLMNQDLPWAAFGLIAIAAACAYHWAGVMTAIRPLLKMRKPMAATATTTEEDS